MSQVSGFDTDLPESEQRLLANPAETSVVPAPFGITQKPQIVHAISVRSVYVELYTESHAAKIWKVARDFLNQQVGTRFQALECILKVTFFSLCS